MTSPTPPIARAVGGLGARLRAVREAAGLTGAELAAALGVGWRQPKVSKIETGRQLPTAEEITGWAAATGTDSGPLLALREKAAAEFGAYKERIAAAGGPLSFQDELTALTWSCTFLAEYQPALVPGRLQTPAYMREKMLGNVFLADSGISEDMVGDVIAAKLRRQSIMYESGRELVHIVGEGALRTRIGLITVGTLRGQLTHLAEMAVLPGHTFGVVPFAVASPVEPASGWALFDRDLVVVETVAGALEITEPDAVARYSRWLEQLLDVALTGPAAAEFCRKVAAELPDD